MAEAASYQVKQSKNFMNKQIPISIVIKNFKDGLITYIENSGITPSIAELVLKDIYNQVAEAAYQEFQNDYKNYQQETNITETNEDKNN